jgi:hypothetical protein
MPYPLPFPKYTAILSPTELNLYRHLAGTNNMQILFGYAITNDGRIFSKRHPLGPRELKGNTTRAGYKRVTLTVNQQKYSFFVHRLVALAFHGPPPDKHSIVRHLDGNPANNHARNLAWGTPYDNIQDARRHGTQARGERGGGARLTEAQVREIRQCLKQGESLRSIGRRFGVSRTAIWHIKKGISWQHLQAVK